MATQLFHIHLWMQKSIAKVKDRIEKRVEKQAELNSFGIWVLARPTLSSDLTTIQF